MYYCFLYRPEPDPKKLNSDGEPMEGTNSSIVSQEDDIPVAEANDIVTSAAFLASKKRVVSVVENERQAITNPVPEKNLKRKYRIKAPIYCSCRKEIKGKCSTCQIRDLKMVVKEKEKQLHVDQNKAKIQKIVLQKLRLKLKEKDKKLKTIRKHLANIRHYATVNLMNCLLRKFCVNYSEFTNICCRSLECSLSKQMDDAVNLTANQLDEKVKHLTHGVSLLKRNLWETPQ